jgi:beta-phosphoglucomutase-like phosphatase (HAD superfamily)
MNALYDESRIDGLIFDWDGTLVDSMPIHYEAYRLTFQEFGLELTQDHFYARIGGKASETIPRMLGAQKAPCSIMELHARKKCLVNDLLRSLPLPVLGTAVLMKAFVGKFKMAMASTGSREGIEIMLARLQWTGYFSAVVTGEDVIHGKPDPDCFLLAAKKIDVIPSKCLVFEDTDAGVEAARRAGMMVFDVRTTVPERFINVRYRFSA